MGKMRKRILDEIREELGRCGIDIDLGCCEGVEEEAGDDGGTASPKVKVVCVTPDLKTSVDEMEQTSRDQVVMVRVDEQTMRALDEWVVTGAVKSRSEAAALFIREGLKVRSAEREKLRDALRDVEAAKERLREQASEVFGDRSYPGTGG